MSDTVPPPDTRIEVHLTAQRLELFEAGRPVAAWPVSTARNGPGERFGSECTPRGWHRVRAMIGRDCPEGAVFVGRRHTGEIWTRKLHARYPGRDWILSRILWLSGAEPGRNRYGEVDTLRRFIYIHGCPDSEPVGTPLSHGCIRMRNADVIDLFERVSPGFPVLIQAPD